MEIVMVYRWAAFFIICLMFFVTPLFAQEEEGGTKEKGKSLFTPEMEKTIENAEKEWLEHLENTPEIFKFQYPEKGKAKTREDLLRMHIFDLRHKSENNRAWYEYWRQQGLFARELSRLYNDAAEKVRDDKAFAKVKTKYKNRKEGIDSWIKLTEAKLNNQDSYLAAIEVEKEAYETRIDDMAMAKAERGKDVDKEDEKEGSNGLLVSSKDEPTPFQKHKSILNALTGQRDDNKAKSMAAKHDGDMTNKLIEATKIMLKAQKADVKLAELELNIASTQAVLKNGDARWSKLWKSIKEKVEIKIVKLKRVYKEKKGSIARLKAEKSYFLSMVEIKEKRVQSIVTQIEKEKGKSVKALLATALDMVVKKGVIVLLYIIGAYIMMLIIHRAAKIIRKKVDDGDDSIISDNEQRAETLVAVFSSIARFAVVIMAILLLLDTVGVNIGPLMGAFAIFGLAISFGSQSLIKDLVTGFFILLENQLSVNDVVTIDGITGTVEKITLRRVVLRDATGTCHSIPNSQVDRVSNKTHGWARAIIHIGVSYNDDLRKVRDVFNEVGQKMHEDPQWKDQLMEAPGFVGVTELGDSAVVVRVWVKTLPHMQWGVERELNLRLKLAADANGIEMPFPQTVVTLNKE